MTRIVSALFIVTLGIVLSGCVSNESESNQSENDGSKKGTIVSIEEGKILVIDGASMEDINTMSSQDIVDKYENGSWFTLSNVENEIDPETGMKVKVWYSSLDTSLPGNGTATKVQVL